MVSRAGYRLRGKDLGSQTSGPKVSVAHNRLEAQSWCDV